MKDKLIKTETTPEGYTINTYMRYIKKIIDTTNPQGVKEFFEIYWEELDLPKHNGIGRHTGEIRYFLLYSYEAYEEFIFKDKENKLIIGNSQGNPNKIFTGNESITIGGMCYEMEILLTSINLYSHFNIK